MESIETINYRGYEIKIYPDDSAENPREAWDNLGTILYRDTSHYLLGDKGVSVEEMEEIANSPDYICLPVYAYIHVSGKNLADKKKQEEKAKVLVFGLIS